MQFCHASKSLAESVFSGELSGKRESHFRLLISLQIRPRIRPEAPTGRPPLALQHLQLVGESSSYPAWQTQRSLKGIAEKRGKCAAATLAIAFAYKTYRYTYLYPHLFSSPSHWHPRGCPLSVDLVYDPATHRSGHD